MRAAAITVVAVLWCAAQCSAASPEQIHIAYAGRDAQGYPTGVRIAWYTADATRTSTVEYGASSSNLSQTATATQAASQYLKGHGYHHVVLVPVSSDGAPLFYRCGDADAGFSAIQRYDPVPARPDAPFSVAIFGDMGWLGSEERPMIVARGGLEKNWTAVPSRALLEQLKNKKAIDAVFHVGDIGYADDAYSHDLLFSYEKAYNGYMNWLQNLTATMPYMVAVGNHESECHSPACLVERSVRDSLSNFTAYNHRWHMPSPESDGVLSMWYSWNTGPVHFVAINTETDFPGAAEETHGDSGAIPAGGFAPSGAYMKWLEADLAKAASERHVRPWIIAGGHRPFHEMDKFVGPLFSKYNVDLYFSGHSHSYYRVKPSEQDARPPAKQYITVGGAGCEEMAFLGANDEAPVPNTIYATNKLAIGVLDVFNGTAVRWQLYSSVNQTVIDEAWFTK